MAGDRTRTIDGIGVIRSRFGGEQSRKIRRYDRLDAPFALDALREFSARGRLPRRILTQPARYQSEVRHALGEHPREGERNVSAHRMTDQRRAFDPDRIEQSGDVRCERFHEIRAIRSA